MKNIFKNQFKKLKLNEDDVELYLVNSTRKMIIMNLYLYSSGFIGCFIISMFLFYYENYFISGMIMIFVYKCFKDFKQNKIDKKEYDIKYNKLLKKHKPEEYKNIIRKQKLKEVLK